MALPINRTTFTVTIANGASLSDAVQTGGMVPLGIILPASWTTAGLSFAVSVDDTNYFALQSMTGEVTASAAASQYIALDPNIFIGINSLKVRSGTAGTPVNQAADRIITVVAKI